MNNAPVTPLAPFEYPTTPVALEPLSVVFMRSACVLPLALMEDGLEIVMADPEDFETVQTLALTYGLPVRVRAGEREAILEAVERLYGAGRQSMETIIEEAEKGGGEILGCELEADEGHLRDMASEAPIIRLVNRLILNAVESRASDIHFEPFESEFRVRYRIDGLLANVDSPPKRLQAAIVSRVKIMARLDISERRLPQDGRIKLRISQREIDFRVSTFPTLFGEGVVMRILDRENLLLDLTLLGFPEELLARYRKLITQPHGMVLVTGPTGSGKTSTLYATLSLINRPENKIVTLEDPVEYQLWGINQIQVNPKIGLTFAGGLRSIVRQDPDVILVGEIRDRETAETAIHSALTGHLLFSTLHTNDSAGAVTRMLDMGVESFLLSSTLRAVLAQRLVRVVCPACRQERTLAEGAAASLGIDRGELEGRRHVEGRGCEACRHTGFRGRTGIFELLPVDEGIRRAVNVRASAEEIRRVAVQGGMVPLRRDGWRKAARGVTTIEEVLRVTAEE